MAHPRLRAALAAGALLVAVLAAPGAPAQAATTFPNVIVPAPVSAVATSGVTFTLSSPATISSDAADIGNYLAGILRTSTGYALPVSSGSGGTVALSLSGAPASVGTQGYQLTAT